MRRNGGTSFYAALLMIAVGMGGELHLHFPALGFMPMLDFVSYVIAIPILALFWTRMGKYMRRSLCWAFLWTMAAMLSNTMNFYDMKYWAKCVSLASSSWAIMAVSYVLLRNYPRGYLWYLVGAGIGGWIALYHFRNGAFEAYALQGIESSAGVGNLMEKQVYPFVVRGILYGSVLPFFIWWRKMPVLILVGAMAFAGFWLLFNGGSRSSFGMFSAAAAGGFAVAYGFKIIKKMAKHPVVVLMLAGVALSVVFGGYKMMANSGTLGESEQQKFENEFGEEGKGVLAGRAGFYAAVEDAVKSYGVGLGGHLRQHSVMANSLSCDGIFGFLFWLYFYLQVLWWVCHRMPYAGKNTAFILLMMLTACWDVFGSPFGTRHKFFVLMAFIALCRDNPCYGVGTIFGESLLMDRGRWFRRG